MKRAHPELAPYFGTFYKLPDTEQCNNKIVQEKSGISQLSDDVIQQNADVMHKYDDIWKAGVSQHNQGFQPTYKFIDCSNLFL